MNYWIVNKVKHVVFYPSGKLRIRRIVISGILLIILIAALVAGNYKVLSVLLVAMVVIPLVIRRAQKKRAVRVATKLRIAREYPHLRSDVGPYLLHNERVDYEGRMHPVAVLRWWLLLIFGPIVGIAITAISHEWIFLGIFVVVPALLAVIPILRWRMTWRVITDKRFILVFGIIVRDAPSIPLTRILMVTPKEPVYLNKFLRHFGIPGVRSYNVDTASDEDEIFHSVQHVPQPESDNPERTVQELLHRQVISVDTPSTLKTEAAGDDE